MNVFIDLAFCVLSNLVDISLLFVLKLVKIV